MTAETQKLADAERQLDDLLSKYSPSEQEKIIRWLLDSSSKNRPESQWRVGNEFLPYHPSASHVSPEYRDGWNACFEAAKRAYTPGILNPPTK